MEKKGFAAFFARLVLCVVLVISFTPMWAFADQLTAKTSGSDSANSTGSVAQVLDSNGDVKGSYDTLQEAISAASSGQTIKLLDDFLDPAPATGFIVYDLTGKTFDLGGYEYSSANFKHVFTGTGGVVKNGKMKSIVSDEKKDTTSSYALFIGDDQDTSPETESFTVDSVEMNGGINICNATGVVLKNLSYVEATNYYAVWLEGNAEATIESGTYCASSYAEKPAFAAGDGIVTLNVEGGNVITQDREPFIYYGGSYRDISQIKIDVSGATFDEKVPALVLDEYGNVSRICKTLQDAIDAAGEGATVKLIDDTDEHVTIAAGKNITLDLNGYTLTNTTQSYSAPTILNKGTLVIQDSSDQGTGTITRVDSETFSHYVLDNQGTMTIKSGTIKNESQRGAGKGASTIRNAGNGKTTATLSIEGGTIYQKDFIAVKNDDLGVLSVTGGTITATNSYTGYDYSAVQNWGNAEISGGELTGCVWTSAWSSDFTNIKTTISGDATVNGNIRVVQDSGCPDTIVPAIEISGGTINADNVIVGSNSSIEISGGDFSIDTWNVASEATAEISGGTFDTEIPAEYCKDGLAPVKNDDGTYSVADYSTAIEQLQKQINTNADAIAALDDTYATDDDVADKIKTAKEAIEAAQKIIDDAQNGKIEADETAIKAIQDKLVGIDGTVADAINAAVDALKNGDVKANADSIAALQNTVSKLDDTYATDDELSNAVDAAKSAIKEYVDTEIANLQTQVTANKNAIDALDDTYATDEDVADKIKTAKEAIEAAQKSIDDAQNSKVDANANNIAAIQNQLTGISTTVADAINAAVDALKNGAVKTNTDNIAALQTAFDEFEKSDVTSEEVDQKISDAKTEFLELANKYTDQKAAILQQQIDALKAQIMMLVNPASVKASAASYDSTKLTWSVGAADGVIINGIKFAKDVATSVSYDCLNTGTKYTYTVTPYIVVNDQEIQGSAITVSATPQLDKGKVNKLKAGKKKVTVKWKKVSGASGYKIKYKISGKTKTITIKSSTKAKKKIKKLKSGKKVKVYVQAYRVVNGKNVVGAWSKAKSVKVK